MLTASKYSRGRASECNERARSEARHPALLRELESAQLRNNRSELIARSPTWPVAKPGAAYRAPWSDGSPRSKLARVARRSASAACPIAFGPKSRTHSNALVVARTRYWAMSHCCAIGRTGCSKLVTRPSKALVALRTQANDLRCRAGRPPRPLVTAMWWLLRGRGKAGGTHWYSRRCWQRAQLVEARLWRAHYGQLRLSSCP